MNNFFPSQLPEDTNPMRDVIGRSAIRIRRELKKILVITYGGIGDILLTTPLISSLKRAFPNARLDVFIQKNRGGILAGNPEIQTVYEAHHRHGMASYISFFFKNTTRYDLAVSTRPSDRQVLFARAEGRTAISLVPKHGQNRIWKKRILSGSIRQNLTRHTVFDILQLTDLLGIPKSLHAQGPSDPGSERRLNDLLPFPWKSAPYAVLHLTPRNRYKRWTLDGWRFVAHHLRSRNSHVVIVGGPSDHEVGYASAFVDTLPSSVVNLVGHATLADAAELLRRCQVYIGLDTGMTHLAAVCGSPTIALYGQAIPRYMPYHNGLLHIPYRSPSPNLYTSNHVHVIEGTCGCRTGGALCEAKPTEPGMCMHTISAESVTTLLDHAYATDC